jgi:hypothetical protein
MRNLLQHTYFTGTILSTFYFLGTQKELKKRN